MPSLNALSLPGPIAILLIPRFTSIALFSIVESLRIANRYLEDKYEWTLLSLDGRPVPDNNGIQISVQGRLDDEPTPYRTLLVCADVEPENSLDPLDYARLRRLAARGIRMGGIDTGAHILAKAGLLDGHRATLHWENQPAFAERYPLVQLTENLYEFDRQRITCAGGTAGIDMMLQAIEEEHGHEIAARVSEHFVHDRIRPGTERQRMEISNRFHVHHPKLVQTIKLMEESTDEPLSTADLATAVKLSSRQLTRLFKVHLGISPSRFLLEMRLERARRLIRQSDMSVIDVALACGFQSHSHFSRVYREHFGCPPRRERRPRSTSCRVLVMDRSSGPIDRLPVTVK